MQDTARRSQNSAVIEALELALSFGPLAWPEVLSLEEAPLWTHTYRNCSATWAAIREMTVMMASVRAQLEQLDISSQASDLELGVDQ